MPRIERAPGHAGADLAGAGRIVVETDEIDIGSGLRVRNQRSNPFGDERHTRDRRPSDADGYLISARAAARIALAAAAYKER